MLELGENELDGLILGLIELDGLELGETLELGLMLGLIDGDAELDGL